MNFDELYIDRLLEREYPAAREEPMLLAKAPTESVIDSNLPGVKKAQSRIGSIEAGMTIGSAIAGSLPAGLAGIFKAIATQDSKKATDTINELMQAFTYIPRTSEGKKQAEALSQALQLLGVPAEYIGDKVFEMTREVPIVSPLAATAATVALDPLNIILSPIGAKAVKSAAKSVKRNLVKSEPDATVGQ